MWGNKLGIFKFVFNKTLQNECKLGSEIVFKRNLKFLCLLVFGQNPVKAGEVVGEGRKDLL